MTENIIIALIAFAGTLAGSYFAQKKSTALVVYRLEQLERKLVGKAGDLKWKLMETI